MLIVISTMAYLRDKSVVCGVILRVLLFFNGYQDYFMERVEVTTPLNSWKRVREGIYFTQLGRSPYEGDTFHETPLSLAMFAWLVSWPSWVLTSLFIVCDTVTAVLLAHTARNSLRNLIKFQGTLTTEVPKDATNLLVKSNQVDAIFPAVMACYLLNPYSILNCVGMTTTVFSNVYLAASLWAISKGHSLAFVPVALSAYQTLYPCMLIVPATLASIKSNSKGGLSSLAILRSLLSVVLPFGLLLAAMIWISRQLSGDWNFISSTYGCILNFPDQTPNVGLFWYFFMEMFEHFHVFFLYVFQLNVFVYLAPLTIKFWRFPDLLAFTVVALIAIFKSYPSVGDVAFYLAFVPTWKHLYPFMRHSFLIGCFFLVTSVLGPLLWHLWIYSGSANANFFFAITLAFSTAQIFLLTDILFAQVKWEYHIRHGMKLEVDGQPAKLVLE